MKFSLLSVIAFLVSASISIHSQALIGGNTDVLSSMNGDLIYGGGDIKGDPYLFNEWSAVEIFDITGGTKELEKGKYDVCSQKLLVEVNDKEIWVNDHQILKFVLKRPGGAREFIKAIDDEDYIYYEVLSTGDISLYSYYSKEFVKPRQTDTYSYGSERSTKPYFKDGKLKYLAKYKEGDYFEIKDSGKGMEDIFPKELKRKAESFMKRNKPKAKNIADLIDYTQEMAAHFNKGSE